MRWIAGEGNWNWQSTIVYDARTGLKVADVKWLDDVTHQVGILIRVDSNDNEIVDVKDCPKVLMKPGQYALINLREDLAGTHYDVSVDQPLLLEPV